MKTHLSRGLIALFIAALFALPAFSGPPKSYFEVRKEYKSYVKMTRAEVTAEEKEIAAVPVMSRNVLASGNEDVLFNQDRNYHLVLKMTLYGSMYTVATGKGNSNFENVITWPDPRQKTETFKGHYKPFNDPYGCEAAGYAVTNI